MRWRRRVRGSWGLGCRWGEGLGDRLSQRKIDFMKKNNTSFEHKKNSLYRERKRIARTRRKFRGGILRQWHKNKIDIVPCPDRLYLYGDDEHDKVVDFIFRLRHSFMKSDKTTVIDFTNTKQLVPAGTLLFYSELARLKSIFPNKNFKFIKSKDSTVNQVMQHLGVYGLTGFNCRVVPEREDVVTWRAVTSVITDGKLAGELIETYESLSRDEIKRIFKGVSEAATNAVEHAYVGARNDGVPSYDQSRWWMFCRETEQKLYVGVCDLGVGIPRSLPKTFGEEVISNLFNLLSLGKQRGDAMMIRAAMDISRTRTEKDERGKGLGDMKRVVDQIPGSVLMIFSNRGLVVYKEGEYQVKNYDKSIMGTIVVWILPIDGEKK